MLAVALIWIYILINSYVWGFTFLRFFGRKSNYSVRNEVSIFLAGISALTVYAETFSLVGKVGLAANIVLIMMTIIMTIVSRKAIAQRISECLSNIKIPYAIIVALLFVLFAYGTSHGYMHYDTDLYHAQSIRWIEEYGVVKGLGNLQTRLAYNSAAFCLSALFSFAFLNIQSFHACAGLLAYLTGLLCIKMFARGDAFKFKLSNLSRIAAIYYLLVIFDEMVSPASDYFVVLQIFCIVILFFDLSEQGVNDYYPYALLSLLGLMVFSSKISGSFIVLIVAYPAYLLIKDHKIKEIIRFVICGIILVIPFIVRNIILSGYLIYPMPGIDIFNFEYKLPNNLAAYDALEIKMYGRNLAISQANLKLNQWFGNWFNSLGNINRIMFLLASAMLLVSLFYVIVAIRSKSVEQIRQLVPIWVIDICFVIWFITSPNIRFGCVFMHLTAILNLGLLYKDIVLKRDKGIILKVCIMAFLVIKAFTFTKESVGQFSLSNIVLQQDYGEYELNEYELHGITFYYPKEGDRTGYKYFPASPLKAEDIFIGDSIEDGFKDVIH